MLDYNLVVVEGADNVGKTTATKIIEDYYHELGYMTKYYNLPGGSQVGNVIRNNIWKDHSVDVMDSTYTPVHLMLACLSEIYKDIQNNKTNNNGKIVFILDRWLYSIMVYHGENIINYDMMLNINQYPYVPIPKLIIGIMRDIDSAAIHYDVNDKQERTYLEDNKYNEISKIFSAKFTAYFRYYDPNYNCTSDHPTDKLNRENYLNSYLHKSLVVIDNNSTLDKFKEDIIDTIKSSKTNINE